MIAKIPQYWKFGIKGGQMRKRGRTSYSPKELEILEKYFKKNPYLNPTLRGYLSKLLGYSAAQLKVWYQNRRMRLKKECGKQEQAAAAAAEDGVSSSESDDNKRIAAQLRARRHNRSEGTSSGSFPPTFPLSNSIDSPEDGSLCYTPNTNFPPISNNNIPPLSNVDNFGPPQPSYQNTGLFQHSASNSTIRGNTLPSTQPHPLQFHHSLYTGSQIPRPSTAFPDSPQRFGYNLTHQNQQGASHSPSYANQTGLGTIKNSDVGNSLYAPGHTNGGYRMQFHHRNYSGRMYPYSVGPHYQVNSLCHSVYKKEDPDEIDLRSDFSRLQFSGMSSTENSAQRNSFDGKQQNRVKVEAPNYPVADENSACSQYSSNYVPNNFNLNFCAPVNTTERFPSHSSAPFNPTSVYYPSQTWNVRPTDMQQMCNNQRRPLSAHGRFLESPNANLSGCSTNETPYYSTVKPNDDAKENFPGSSCLDKSVNAYKEIPEKYMDCLSPETSELSLASGDGNNPNCELETSCNMSEESDIPSWEQIFSEPLRRLQDLTDVECCAQPTRNLINLS